jgi:hypothetical protein
MSRQHYVAKHQVEVESEVAGGADGAHRGILPTMEYSEAKPEPEPEPELEPEVHR